jgi:hypothetical protein
MAYSAEISRTNPACFLFLIDQSGSMNDSYGGESSKRKANGAADAVNNCIRTLTLRCARPEGPRDYFHIGVIGYGSNVGPAFGGVLAGKELVPISEVANFPLRIEERDKKVDDGAGGLVTDKVKFPVWFEPVANGGTPMCQALGLVIPVLEKWISVHPNCYPPVVLNISDGEPTDGDPRNAAESIKKMASSDGNVLLLNAHLSSSNAAPLSYPDSEEGLHDDHAKLLFQMSSVIPDKMRESAQGFNIPTTDKTKGYVFQADQTMLIQWLVIGTRTGDLR